MPVLKEKIFENIERNFGIKLPTATGMDTIACLKAAYNDKIDLAFILGGNLYNANPDASFTEKSLNAIPCKIFLNTTLNHGHFHSIEREVLILPVSVRDE